MHIDNSEDLDAQVLKAVILKQNIPFPAHNQGHILDLIAIEKTPA